MPITFGRIVLNSPLSSSAARRETTGRPSAVPAPRAAVSQVTTRAWSFAEDVLAAQQAGLSGVGVWRWKLHELGLEKAVDLLQETGVTVSSLSSAGGFTGSDNYSHQDSILEGREAVREAAALRAHCLVVISGGRASHTRNHVRRMVIDAFRSLGDLAGEKGLSVAVQPIRASEAGECTFLNTLDATLDILHATDHPHVGLVFDSYHLAEELELASRIPEIAPLVRLALLSDRRPTPEGPVRCLPGRGNLPLADWTQWLELSGFRGPYEVHVPTRDLWEEAPEDVHQEAAAALSRLLPLTVV